MYSFIDKCFYMYIPYINKTLYGPRYLKILNHLKINKLDIFVVLSVSFDNGKDCDHNVFMIPKDEILERSKKISKKEFDFQFKKTLLKLKNLEKNGLK